MPQNKYPKLLPGQSALDFVAPNSGGTKRMGNGPARTQALPTAAAQYTSNPTGAQTFSGPTRPMGSIGFAMDLAGAGSNARGMVQQANAASVANQRANAFAVPQDVAYGNRVASALDYRPGVGINTALAQRANQLADFKSSNGGQNMSQRFLQGFAGTAAANRGMIARENADQGFAMQPGGYGSALQFVNRQKSDRQVMEDAYARMQQNMLFTSGSGAKVANRVYDGPYMRKAEDGSLAYTSKEQALQDAGLVDAAANRRAVIANAAANTEARRDRAIEARGGMSPREYRSALRLLDTPEQRQAVNKAMLISRRGDESSPANGLQSALTLPSGKLDPVNRQRALDRLTNLTTPGATFDNTPEGQADARSAAMLQDIGLTANMNRQTASRVLQSVIGDATSAQLLESNPDSAKALIEALQVYAKSQRDIDSKQWARTRSPGRSLANALYRGYMLGPSEAIDETGDPASIWDQIERLNPNDPAAIQQLTNAIGRHSQQSLIKSSLMLAQ